MMPQMFIGAPMRRATTIPTPTTEAEAKALVRVLNAENRERARLREKAHAEQMTQLRVDHERASQNPAASAPQKPAGTLHQFAQRTGQVAPGVPRTVGSDRHGWARAFRRVGGAR